MSRLGLHVVFTLGALAPPAASQHPPPSFVALFGAIEQSPAVDPSPETWQGLRDLRPRDAAEVFERESRRWVSEAAPGNRPRRRAVAASVALFAANRIGARDWRAGVALLERGCTLIRQNDIPTESERHFHHAANALLQADRDSSPADFHASHAHRRFPNDPRIVLARAIALEMRTWPDADSRTPADRDRDLMMRLLDRLDAAAAYAETRAEALLRLAVLASRNRYDAQAVAHLRKVDTTDPFLIYLAGLFEGRSEERRERYAEAEAAYRRALAATSGAQSAGMALSALLVRQGRVEEARLLMKEITTTSPQAVDPWSGYVQGDLRYWDRIVRDLLRSLE